MPISTNTTRSFRLPALIGSIAVGMLASSALAESSIRAAGQPSAPAGEPATTAPESQADLPSADSIFDKYLEVTGGLDAHLAHKTRLYTGTVEANPGDYFALMTIGMKAPNQMMLRLEQPGSTTETTYFDGQNAWIVDSRGNSGIIVGERLRNLAQSSQFHTIADYANFYDQRRQTIREIEINGRPAWHVEVTSIYRKPEAHYFDQETGLLIATDQIVQIPPAEEGAQPTAQVVRSLFSEYEEVDGVLMFTRIEQFQGESRSTVRMSKIETNVADFPSMEKPQEVIATLERFEAAREAQAEGGESPEPNTGG